MSAGAQHGMRQRPFRGALLPLLLAMLAGGCASGPPFHRPPPPQAADWDRATPASPLPAQAAEGVAVQSFVDGLAPDQRWWRQFGSERLDALVEQGLRDNTDLRSARASLRAAEESAAAQRAALLPSAQLGYSASRQRDPTGTLAPSLNSGAAVYNLHTAQVQVGYVPDVFGGSHRLVEQSEALAEVQRCEAEATWLSVAANLVLAAVQEAGLQAQIEATQELIRVQRQQTGLLEQQLLHGAIAEADVIAQRAATAQLEAGLPVLAKALEQQQHLLASLAGRGQGGAATPPFRLDELRLPDRLPAVVPAQLVDRRPDVRAAEAQIHVASAGLGVARSNRLPQFALTASLGGTSTRLGDLLAPANTFWTLAASVTQSVFDGGALAHREAAADATLEQASALYRGTVLTAFQNVADALSALAQDAQADLSGSVATTAAAQSLAIARKVQALGASGSAPVLLAEQQLLQARLAALAARTNRLADSVALYQSLGGGGWEQGADAAAPRRP